MFHVSFRPSRPMVPVSVSLWTLSDSFTSSGLFSFVNGFSVSIKFRLDPFLGVGDWKITTQVF